DHVALELTAESATRLIPITSLRQHRFPPIFDGNLFSLFGGDAQDGTDRAVTLLSQYHFLFDRLSVVSHNGPISVEASPFQVVPDGIVAAADAFFSQCLADLTRIG